MMPLALLGVGESGTITDIRGKEEVDRKSTRLNSSHP